MKGVERPFGAVTKVGAFKGVFVVKPRNQETAQGTQPRGNPFLPPLGVIEVIHVASTGTLVTQRKGVLTVVPMENGQDEQPFEKRLSYTRESITSNDNDLEGMTQPHDDALVVTARINGFIVKRVLVD